MEIDLLIQPKKMIKSEGNFIITPDTQVVLEDLMVEVNTGKWLQEKIEKVLGFKIPLNRSFKRSTNKCIYLKIENGVSESYCMRVTPEYIEISGGDTTGLFYGVKTLCELIGSYYREIPCVFIEDEPYFSVRGFYHDITRGKVPTLDTLKSLADMAASYKLNQLQLYVEHSFAFKSHSEVWVEADPLTAEEIILFDEYCRERHIELVPSLSTFGHLYEALSSYSFYHLCELENSLKEKTSFIDRQRKHTLDVLNPESLDFVRDMLEQFIPLFSSNKFNICADETFDLGEGKNKEEANQVGKGRLYVDFLNKIIDIVKTYNKKVMFWGDIIINYPELIKDIPDDVICLDWDYDKAPEEYKRKIIANSGRQQYLCPSVVGWNTFMNDMETSFCNISKMVEYGEKYKVAGILNTDWGDYGHINLFANLIPGMIYGAALSWNPDQKDDIFSLNRKIAQMHYQDPEGKLINLIYELYNLQAITFREVVWWQERNDFEQIKDYTEKEVHQKYYSTLAIEEKLLHYLAIVPTEKNLDVKEFCVSAKGIALFNGLYLVLKKYELGQPVNQLIYGPDELASKIEYWLQDYNRVWRARNKESELFRIKDTIIGVCRKLRCYGKKYFS